MRNVNGTLHWKVGEVAERARVTVRALHHSDEIGLLVPSGRTEAGYRLYSESDLERLYRILIYRELGFPLETIARVINDAEVNLRTALRAHREGLVERRRQTDAVIRAVDRMLESMERGERMNSEEVFAAFEELANAPDDVRRHQGATRRGSAAALGRNRRVPGVDAPRPSVFEGRVGEDPGRKRG